MYDLDVLRLSATREEYYRFKDHVKSHNVGESTYEIFTAIDDYYNSFPDLDVIEWDKFATYYNMFKLSGKKNAKPYNDAFATLIESPVASPLAPKIREKLVNVDYAVKINNEAVKIAINSKDGSYDTIKELLDSRDKELIGIDDEKVFVEPTLEYLSRAMAGGGYEWRLEELNVSFGPLRDGDFILVAGRVETGKTTLVLSEATHMLSQLPEDKHVIWVNNEEASNKVMARAIQSCFGVTLGDLMANRADYESSWLSKGGSRFLIVGDDSGYNSVHKLNSLFKRNKPGLIIFDQLDKVEGFYQEKEQHARIGKVYQWARTISKTLCPVIALSQLDATAEGEKYPGMDKLRGSKTDKPAEADGILLIGNLKDGTLNRYLNVDKNKLVGGPRTLEGHRHGKFQVEIQPHLARYKSLWTLMVK